MKVYDFAEDQTQVRLMQQATLGPTDFGVSPQPALVGTPEWWRAIGEGRLPMRDLEGTISRVLWGSMGDWPEFELCTSDGATSVWTREGDPSRYVEGLHLRLCYVLHPWKVPQEYLGLGAASKIVLRIDVERSEKRSDPRAPGPGGVGLRKPVEGTLREYKAIVWTDDPTQPGQRVTLLAKSLTEAREKLKENYGKDLVCTLYNEDDQQKLR